MLSPNKLLAGLSALIEQHNRDASLDLSNFDECSLKKQAGRGGKRSWKAVLLVMPRRMEPGLFSQATKYRIASFEERRKYAINQQHLDIS